MPESIRQLDLFSENSELEYSAEHPPTLGSAILKYADTSQILTKATGFMSEYNYTLNPYAGCGFGCTYCYAAFFARDAKKRDTWGDWVNVKQNAVEILRRPRQQAKLDGARIYMSSVTDAYQPIERELGLTRGLLEIMADGHTPKLVVQTRSPDVTRDIDLFQQIDANGGRVQINMTVTTDDEAVRKIFEPSCPSNPRRIDAIKTVHDLGVQSCITLTPLIWATDIEAFADRLIETGVRKLIIQPFKFTRGKFVAQTRQGALQLMANLLDCAADEKIIEREYMKRYQDARAHLRTVAAGNGIWIGEERDGFAPPF